MKENKLVDLSKQFAVDIVNLCTEIKENRKGNVLTFKFNHDTDLWEELFWSTIWSTNGSASEVIYPYWWHFIYGGF